VIFMGWGYQGICISVDANVWPAAACNCARCAMNRSFFMNSNGMEWIPSLRPSPSRRSRLFATDYHTTLCAAVALWASMCLPSIYALKTRAHL